MTTSRASGRYRPRLGPGWWRAIYLSLLPILLSLLLAAPARAQAAGAELKIAMQQGLLYLPLYVIRERGLLKDQLQRRGLGAVELRLVMLGSASALPEMLLSDSAHMVAGAVAPLLTLSDRTHGAQKVKGVANLSNATLYLNTNNPRVRTLRDFGEQDRIAVSGVGLSLHAILLQMAAGQTFGEGQERRLDPLTVSMPHPDAVVALLSGGSHITAHFATPPYQAVELKDPRIHGVLTSTDILGGPSPAVILCTTEGFYDANRVLMEALAAAAEDAVAWIAAHPAEAANTYLRAEPQRASAEEILALLESKEVQFSTTPENTFKIAQFMQKLGRLRKPVHDWRDFFFPTVRGNGS